MNGLTQLGIRFVSFEPLIGPLNGLDLEEIHWVIVEGESGPGARPNRAQWVRDYYNNKLSFGQMESDFTYSCLETLKEERDWGGFERVLNIPIKDKSKNIAKYRMIFGTNHINGAPLMGEI